MDAPPQFDAADVLKQEQRPFNLAEFPQRHGETILPWVCAKLAQHQRCGDRAVLDRRGETEDLVPMASDLFLVHDPPMSGASVGYRRLPLGNITDPRSGSV